VLAKLKPARVTMLACDGAVFTGSAEVTWGVTPDQAAFAARRVAPHKLYIAPLLQVLSALAL
jgi:hypothetical protein